MAHHDKRQVDDLTQNTTAIAVLAVYAFARVDALRIDYTDGSVDIFFGQSVGPPCVISHRR